MNKTEVLIVSLLVALLIGLGYYKRPAPQPAHVPPAATYATTSAVTNAPTSAAPTSVGEVVAAVPPSAQAPAAAISDTLTNALTSAAPATPVISLPLDTTPEQRGVLSNALLAATISSHGGGIQAVTLNEFRAEDHAESVLILDFSNSPALSLTAQGWLSAGNGIQSDAAATSAQMTFHHPSGLLLTRELSLNSDYLISVKDTISNPTDLPLTVASYRLQTGPMQTMGTAAPGAGIMVIGVDSLSAHGGEGVHYWGKDLATTLFGLSSSGCRAPDASGASATGSHYLKDEAEWISAKNKFFVQMLLSKTATEGVEFNATRDVAERSLLIDSVAAAFRYSDRVLNPNESDIREVEYYVGPKSLSHLKKLGRSADKTMEFGKRIGWICEWLLITLNAIHSVIPNYGVAIILLTVVVRLLLWPITAKSTKSMKRMKDLQPKLEAIQLKYKDKPQKMNEERMALFKAEKVNPMAGCLPMLFQLPVFFALYTMLQSAVELRFAPFLWVQDLSSAELLFSNFSLFQVLPFSLLHGLNILPLLMTGATVWQMKLTPVSGDPQQRQMMMIMPYMMMFMMYNMAAGLMLYWTTSTLISILQTSMANADTSTPSKAVVPTKRKA